MPATEIEAARVYRDEESVGTIRRTPKGSVFEYNPAYLQGQESHGIALHLPLRTEPFRTQGVNLHPFFAGLLPEGLLLEAARMRAKTSADDLLSILLEAGPETIGDVHVQPPSEELETPSGPTLEEAVEESFAASWEKALEGRHGASIGGVMPKISAGRVTLRLRTAQAALLKLAPPELPRLVENEHFWLQTARKCGLKTAGSRIVEDRKGVSGLWVERFDRVWDPGRNRLIRLHQEDGCQILDRYPESKYRLSLREIADGIFRYCSAPKVQVLRLLEQYFFNYMIVNADMHAKNVSVLRDAKSGLLEISPLYDVVSVAPYKGYDRNMALKLDGKDDGFRFQDFTKFAVRWGLGEPALRASFRRISECLTSRLDQVDQLGFAPKESQAVKNLIAERARHFWS